MKNKRINMNFRKINRNVDTPDFHLKKEIDHTLFQYIKTQTTQKSAIL